MAAHPTTAFSHLKPDELKTLLIRVTAYALWKLGTRSGHSPEMEAEELTQNIKSYIIGGAQIYSLALETSKEMILTLVDTEQQGDAWFPEFNKDEWTLNSTEDYPADEKNEHPFKVCKYLRK